MKDKSVARAFGRVLRAARLACGLTQEELAAEAEMDRTYPSLLEHGKREPTLSVIVRLAKALHCAPTALISATLAQLPAAYASQWLVFEVAPCDPLPCSTAQTAPPQGPHRLQAA